MYDGLFKIICLIVNGCLLRWPRNNMSMSFNSKLLFSVVILNLTIALLLYRYTTSKSPLMLIAQLMLPLIIWQIVLAISFFPDEFIAHFLDDFYRIDGAAGDQSTQQALNFSDSIHSHGDFPQTPSTQEEAEQQISNF